MKLPKILGMSVKSNVSVRLNEGRQKNTRRTTRVLRSRSLCARTYYR